MKIKIMMLEKDKLYIKRFVQSLNSRYFNELTIFVFDDLSSAVNEVKNTKIDVIISSEEFDISQLKSNSAVAYFSQTNDTQTIKGEKAVGKYQSIELIYKDILSLYSETTKSSFVNSENSQGTKLVGFCPASGGVGATSVAIAYARYLACAGHEVMYLDLNRNGIADLFLSGDGKATFDDLIYAIKSSNINLALKIESCAKRDSCGVYFYSSCKTILNFIELNEDETIELITTLKNISKYDYIIIDMAFDFSSLSMKILDLLYKLFVVCDGTEVSIYKLNNIINALSLLNEQKGNDYFEKTKLIYNKYISEKSNTIDSDLIETAGGIPYLNISTNMEIISHISLLKMFEAKMFE